MHDTAGQRRAMQDGAGQCRTKTVQESVGQCRTEGDSVGQGQLRAIRDGAGQCRAMKDRRSMQDGPG
jgi:hypothetical protein